MKLLVIVFSCVSYLTYAQGGSHILLKADRVFDGIQMHKDWSVLITGNKIESAGVITNTPPNTTIISLPGATLMPGLIEGHSHLFLHPYNETSWNEQVLNESRT